MKKTVLQKYIASSGNCSRRKAEELIRLGMVSVNGQTAELGMKASSEDEVLVEGKVIRPVAEKIYIKLNKPVGYTCSSRKFKGEKNVFELLKTTCHSDDRRKEESREACNNEILRFTQNDNNYFHVVGRLDKNSRGLVILTNDGDFTEKMTHPRYEHEKEYLVTIYNFQFVIYKQLLNDLISKFENGLDIGEGDGIVRAKSVEYLGDGRFRIILTEGKKRQIRRMFAVFDLKVEDLLRVRIGKTKLGSLKEGEWEYFNL